MNNITLIVIPGPGAKTLTLDSNTTVQQLVNSENLSNRDIIINGQGILPSDYANTTIPENAEVFATGSVKGNGSESFVIEAFGSSASFAFDVAVRTARQNYGDNGYTGTIAEKNSFNIVDQDFDSIHDAMVRAEELLNTEPFRDKWGPAGCFDLGDSLYLFFGWASC